MSKGIALLVQEPSLAIENREETTEGPRTLDDRNDLLFGYRALTAAPYQTYTKAIPKVYQSPYQNEESDANPLSFGIRQFHTRDTQMFGMALV